MPRAGSIAQRTAEIARIDAVSRTRALTPRETDRLATLLERERYAALEARRQAA